METYFIKKRRVVLIGIGGISIEAGWFSGEPFCIADINVLELSDEGVTTILLIKFAKLILSVTYG